MLGGHLDTAVQLALSGADLVGRDGQGRTVLELSVGTGHREMSLALLLIAKLFVWEVAFDFVHYWCHRLSHAHPLVYRLSHRTHHRGYRSQKTPTPLATYQQGALDLCVSNAIPAAFALAVVDATLGPVGAAAQEVLWAQKVFVEVAGHNGLDETTWTAFPVCVWLPRVLDIHIRSRDHHMHHKRPSCNFGKRTTLWDRAFGTLATV